MHRRPLAPTRAASAVWARRLALAAALLAGVAVAAAHHPRVSPAPALLALAAALAGAVLAILCGLAALRTIWRTGQPGLGRALLGLGLAGLTLAYPAYVASKVLQAPIAVGAATDAASPPRLSRSVRATAARGRVAATHAEHLASLAPITLDATGADAFDVVRQAVADLRWRLLEAVPPGGRLGLSHIDAVAFTPVMHLPQDIAIVLTPMAGQTRVDVLSTARLGGCDFGTGLRTIRQLDDAIEAQEGD